MQESPKFEGWGIVELFGHQMIAGKISEATIGGCSFVRVDVPNTSEFREVNEVWAYTRYFGQGAIYALNPTSELVARRKAAQCQDPPFAWEINSRVIDDAVNERMRRLTASQQSPDVSSEQTETLDDPNQVQDFDSL